MRVTLEVIGYAEDRYESRTGKPVVTPLVVLMDTNGALDSSVKVVLSSEDLTKLQKLPKNGLRAVCEFEVSKLRPKFDGTVWLYATFIGTASSARN